MIRPITIEDILRFWYSSQHLNVEGWLVGAVMAAVIACLIYVLWLYVLVCSNKEKVCIRFIPASSDTTNIERMEELFRFSGALLLQQRGINRLLPLQSIAVEIVATPVDGMVYQLWIPFRVSTAIMQGMKGIFPGSLLQQVDIPATPTSSSIRHFRLRYRQAAPLRVVTKEYVADPASFLASSLSDLQDNEQVIIQFVVQPLRGLRAWRLHRVNLDSFGSQSGLIEHKLRQSLFTTSVRLLATAEDISVVKKRMDGVISALFGLNQAHLQEIKVSLLWNHWHKRLVRWSFAERLTLFSPQLTLSAEELSSLVHPAAGRVARTEDVTTNRSKLLPLPTALKSLSEQDGVVIGSAAGSSDRYPVVLTDDDRSRHVYILGQTGSGKSTILFHMASKDISDGHGVAVIDPHGDLIDDLLSGLVATSGRNQGVNEAKRRVVLIDPADLRYPVGINLLELPSDITDPDELEMEKELVCEAVISIFKRVFNQEEEANSHRIEYILRNVIHTAFIVPDATIFTIYDLINNPEYRKSVISKLRDENLLSFWKNEFLKAGNWQQVKMVSGVTAKIGRFLFSPTVKRILEQPHSTINFDEVLDQGKVLLCNLSEGKIGEDNSHLMGAVIITKIHLAALRRARLEQSARRPFYLYVDEFQHFATNYFTRLLSGGRKFGLRVLIAQQSTAQLRDPQMIQVILANTGTVIAFRTASSADAELLLPLFEPLVTREDIVNLPRHMFYVKLGSNQAQPAFSGRTSPIEVEVDPIGKQRIIAQSRQQNAREYSAVERPAFSETETDKPRYRKRKQVKPKAKSSGSSQARLA